MKPNELIITPHKVRHRRWRSVVFISVLAAAVATTALLPRPVTAATILDPNNPLGTFQPEGTQPFTAGATLLLGDTSGTDFINFYSLDNDAAPGTECDLIATFRVTAGLPANADAGNRVMINDGVAKSAIAACVVMNGVKGIGLYSSGSRLEESSYPVFVPVDWQAVAVTIRLRRTALGDVELIEVNDVAPSPRALLTADRAPANTRSGATVEFGCASLEAECTVEYSAFRSERVVNSVAGTLNFTRLRLRDTESIDRIQLRADYTLCNGSDGINPAAEPVTIKLSTPGGGQFYPVPDFNPLVGFEVQGRAQRRRWTLNDSERARTGMERLVFDEDPGNKGGIFLRDFRASIADANYSIVNVEVTIGMGAAQDKLTGTAQLVERPAGSGRWRLAAEN